MSVELGLRHENKLRVFENRTLRKTFGPKKHEVMRGWRQLNNEELHNLYSSPNKITIMKSRTVIWARNAARIRKWNSYRVLVRKPRGRKPTGRPRSR
jgi:hypothetical protein